MNCQFDSVQLNMSSHGQTCSKLTSTGISSILVDSELPVFVIISDINLTKSLEPAGVYDSTVRSCQRRPQVLYLAPRQESWAYLLAS